MRKFVFIIFIAVFSFVFLVPQAFAQTKSCGDRGTNNWCGEAGGCEAGSLCKNVFGYSATCTPNEKCQNMNQSNGSYCGVTSGTPGLCNAGGSCAEGYMCVDPLFNDPYCELNSSCQVTTPPAEEENTEPEADAPLICGGTTSNANATCGCSISGASFKKMGNTANYCCGWVTAENTCANQAPQASSDDNTTGSDGSVGSDDSTGTVETTENPQPDIFEGPNSADFKALNPLEMFNSTAKTDLSSPGGIISRILLFAFPIAGLILFVMLVWAGFEIIYGSAGGKSIDAGRQRATAAILGFGLLFVSYWLMQIVEVIFGVTIL